MQHTKIIEILNNLATLLEIKGESPFKSGAYKTAADIIETQGIDVEQLAKDGKLSEINGFGKALEEKLTDLIENGRMSYYDKIAAEVPESLLELTKIEGLGTKKIGRLFRELSITNIEQLAAASRVNKVAELSGFGKKTQEKILQQIDE